MIGGKEEVEDSAAISLALAKLPGVRQGGTVMHAGEGEGAQSCMLVRVRGHSRACW